MDEVPVAFFSSVWIFLPCQSIEAVRSFDGNKVKTYYYKIDSPYGHDSFLLEYVKLTGYIKKLLSSL